MEQLHNKPMTLEEINELLSQTLRDVVSRKISLKQASTISKIATNISKIISITELKNRIELVEQVLKNRK
jgi:hypothetical protein